MSLSGSAWSNDLFGRLSGIGFTGTSLKDLCDAIGNAGASHVSGKAFATTDTGGVSGSGTGTGVGITGLSAGNISNNIFGQASAGFGQSGTKLKDLCDAIAAACVAQLATATLTSTNSPVYSGSGMVTVGSIAVNGGAWGSAVHSSAGGFVGSQWSGFANAIGQGQATEVVAAGTGTVTISGSGDGSGSGSGSGSGTIS